MNGDYAARTGEIETPLRFVVSTAWCKRASSTGFELPLRPNPRYAR